MTLATSNRRNSQTGPDQGRAEELPTAAVVPSRSEAVEKIEPSKWPLMALGDLFTIARGGSPRPIDDFLTEDPDGINWIMIGDTVEGSKYITQTRKRIRKEGISRSRQVGPGDLLLTNSMSFGHPYILATSGCIHDGWLVLSPRSINIDANYFYHLLGSPLVYAEFERLAAGAVVKNLNCDLVRGVRVPVPSLLEQRRIAGILDKAGTIVRKRNEAINLAEKLLDSVFLDAFGDPVTNPKSWPVTTLGEQATQMKYGTSEKCTIDRDGLPVLRIPNIAGGEVNWSEIKYAKLDKREVDSLTLQPGDLLFVRSNGNPDYIARCAVYDSKRVALFASYLIRVRLSPSRLHPIYVRGALSAPSYRKLLSSQARTTAGNYNISTEGLRRIRLPCPPLELQERFALADASVHTARERLSDSQQEAELLFSTLVQKAFPHIGGH